MNERSYIELLSNRLQTRGVVKDAGADAAQLARAGFSGGPIADRYSPKSRIGRGRLGEIYDALDAVSRDVGVERRVALQRIDDRIVAERRFVDELERGYALLRAGAHPNVVKTIDFIRDGKAYYLVMELLEGLSLRSVLDDAAPDGLSLDETASIVRAVGDGLQYLHAKSMVHGDVRPPNVFITFDYAVKLLDVAPMSPLSGVPYRVEDAEQAPRSRDVRDDVYDLACLTYELLSGRHPFNANSPYDAHRAGLTVKPLPDLTVRQWQAIARALALQRPQRTSSVAQFLDEFGISGSERLRATDVADAPETQAHVVPLHAVTPAPSTVPMAPRYSAAPLRALAIDADREPWPSRQRRETGAPLRSLLLFFILVGIGAAVFWNYDAVRAGATELIADVSAVIAPRQSSPTVQTASEVEPDPLPVQQTEAELAAAAPADVAAPNAVAAAQPSPAAEQRLPTETVEQNVAVAVEIAPAAAPPSAPAAAEQSARPSASSRGPAFRFAQSVVTVGESQTAAAVVIERSAASAPATIVWWTTDNTAVADEDYADLGRRTERFGADERSRTVYIPLVRDSLPERIESFSVYLGRYDAARGHLEALANVRVNIRDDD